MNQTDEGAAQATVFLHVLLGILRHTSTENLVLGRWLWGSHTRTRTHTPQRYVVVVLCPQLLGMAFPGPTCPHLWKHKTQVQKTKS